MSISTVSFHFEDPSGQPLAGGSVELQLSYDAMSSNFKQVAAGRTVEAALDANGNATIPLYLNTDLTPAGATYDVRAYTAQGLLAYDKQLAFTVLPTPTFNPPAGTYLSVQNVTITSVGADAIYYTTDGSTPTTGSTLYSGAISVASTETVKALAVKVGWTNSAIGSAAYTITTLPIFIASIEAIEFGGTNSVTGAVGGAASIDTTGATLLVAIIRGAGGGFPFNSSSISDSKSNTWTIGTTYSHSGAAFGNTIGICVAYVVNPTTSTAHTFSPNWADGSCDIFAFKGATGWTLDTEKGFSPFTTGTSIATDSITPSSPNSVILAGIISNGTPASTGTVNNGFTGGQGVAAGAFLPQNINASQGEIGGGAYLIQSSAAPISATFTTTGSQTDWGWIIAAFKHP